MRSRSKKSPPQTSCYLFSTPSLKRTNLHEIAAMMARPISSMNFWGNTTLHKKTQAHRNTKAPQLCITYHTEAHKQHYSAQHKTHRHTQATLLSSSILPPASVTWKHGQGVSRPLQISAGEKRFEKLWVSYYTYVRSLFIWI